MSSSYLLVAAIDFGTTFSGYAFSLRHDYDRDPLKISANNWTAGSGNLVSLKTSTCVLFDPSGKFHSFGYEAEDKYSNLALDEEHEDWYYFRRFKMMLYGKMNLHQEDVIEDDKGKSMEAIKVFSSGIGYLKNHMIKTCKSQLTDVSETDILWVLTVPAIWNDSAKQFMRRAAEKAGISSEMLKIALEPEAASLFCKHLPVEKVGGKGKEFGVFRSGSKYLVLDAGGGTIDITVHEVQSNQKLKELHKANGGDWGGTKVDAAFRSLLADIVGNDVMDVFDSKHKCDFLDLQRDFEVKKRTITQEMKDKVTFKIPINLLQTFRECTGKEIKDALQSKAKYKGKLTWTGDKLRMEADLTKRLFDESCHKIVNHLGKLLREPSCRGVGAILMVGGFSESPLLRAAVEQNFPNMKVIVPQDAGLAVLKGAVLYGHEPETIKSRVCKMTYGIKTTNPFIDDKHPESKRFVAGGITRCRDIFSIHVTEGQTVNVGEKQQELTYTVIEEDQTEMAFEIWVSEERNPKYVTDPGCSKLGKMTISMPDTSKGMDRGALVSMKFGGTEIEVEAVDPDTKIKETVVVDFLG